MRLTQTTTQSIIKEILNSTTPVIIDFYSDWCGACKLMSPVFYSLSEEYKGRLKFLKVNVQSHPELANEFRVLSIPTLVITEKKKEIDRIIGFTKRDIIKSRIDDSLMK